MGIITKTITLNVPVSVVYDAVKSISAKDVRDKSSGFLSKLKSEYLFKRIDENACEVTIIGNFKGYVKLSVEQAILSYLIALKMLEYGYNKK